MLFTAECLSDYLYKQVVEDGTPILLSPGVWGCLCMCAGPRTGCHSATATWSTTASSWASSTSLWTGQLSLIVRASSSSFEGLLFSPRCWFSKTEAGKKDKKRKVCAVICTDSMKFILLLCALSMPLLGKRSLLMTPDGIEFPFLSFVCSLTAIIKILVSSLGAAVCFWASMISPWLPNCAWTLGCFGRSSRCVSHAQCPFRECHPPVDEHVEFFA